MSHERIKAHPAVLRVEAVLARAGVADRIVVLDDTARTVADAAAALGVVEGAIVKSLVFLADSDPLLVLASGGHRVDTDFVGAELGLDLQRADANLVREVTGMSIGGVAPVGHLRNFPVYLDVALGDFDVVWAAAGHPHAVWPTNLAELLALTGGRAVAVAR